MTQVPRCLNCGYTLFGLPGNRCPECGREFNLDWPATYSTKPPFVPGRYWLPAFTAALVLGLAAYWLLVGYYGIGVAVTFVLPFCLGTFVGYGCRVNKFVAILLALIVLAGCLIGLFTLSLVGIFCGLVLGGVALGPLLVGTLIGAALRQMLKGTQWDQRWHLPALGLLLVPAIWAALEPRFHGAYADERVSTRMTLPVPPGAAWHAVMFYEELNHRQSWLLRLALPHPIGASGRSESVGDIKVCLYNTGHLTKKVTQSQPNEKLVFEVIEQFHVMNRAVKLEGGSFEFEPRDGNTDVVLTTQYQPELGPRWVWSPVEAFGVHSLHKDVLEGMRIKATADQARQLLAENPARGIVSQSP